MHPNTDSTPATAQPQAGPGTGTAAQAITPPEDAKVLHGYTVASIAYLDATAAHYRADAEMYRALAKAHLADPYLPQSDRLVLASTAERRADVAEQQALAKQQRADLLRAENPAVCAAAAGTYLAVIVLTVQRDKIQQTARLVLGSPRSVSRTWDRVGASSWKSRDPEWANHEDRVGVELTEYMDALELPTRVAAMLPQPPSPASSAAARAAQEVARG